MDNIINSFPGYEFIYDESDKKYHNIYRDTDVGMGGYVYAEPGMYTNVALLDVASMHPSSIIALNYFGEYTQRFKELMDIRIAIKHRDFETARSMFDGKLAKYLENEESADTLSKALKLPINGSYGLTAANFDNPMRDIRNKNNIVALRGALFMKTLQDEVRNRGFIVAHVKTDSIKIPNATREIVNFVMDFGKQYGYTFEHEASYDRMCLVNNAVYVAKYATAEKCEKLYGYIPGDNKKHPGEWTATGTQFQVPYVFKKLFTKEPIEFKDMCETKSVKTAIYLDMNERLPDVSEYEKELGKTEDKYKKGKLSDIVFENTCEDLHARIEEGHSYQFVGRVGSFCPIKPGCNGGVLLAERNGKFDSVTGAKDYRWLESEMVKELGKEDDIDRSYYDNLVTEAAHAIAAYGDLEWFISDDLAAEPFPTVPEEDEIELPWN